MFPSQCSPQMKQTKEKQTHYRQFLFSVTRARYLFFSSFYSSSAFKSFHLSRALFPFLSLTFIHIRIENEKCESNEPSFISNRQNYYIKTHLILFLLAKSIIISDRVEPTWFSIEIAKSKTVGNIEAVNISILVKLNTLRKQKRHQRQQ